MSDSRKRYKNLGEFIVRLDAEGELIRIREKVSPLLQITEITDRVCKSAGGGKALLFENVDGSDMPLLINAFGSEKRMAMALGVGGVEEIARQIESLLNMAPPESFGDKLKMIPLLLDMAKFPPRKTAGRASCQEVTHKGDDVDLSMLPALQCWPLDAGRFITFPLVFSTSLDGRRNLGMYRMQIFDRNTTGMHWHIHKDGAHQFHEYKKAGGKMPVAVAIGSDPAVTYAATAPLPRGVDELLLAGLIRKKPVTLVKCLTQDLWVPAEAEIVLEGYVDPAEDLRLEGPFGDHTGYYSLADDYPVFHVTAITHRKNPVYFTTIVGKPPMEDCYMGRATSRIFLPMLKTILPELLDYDLPWEGVFHNCVLLSMEKRFPFAAHRLMNGLWGTGQMSFAKMILALGEDADVHDYRSAFREFLDNFDVNEDLFYSEGILDVLDHSAPQPLRGSKLGIDSTPRVSGENERVFPALKPIDDKEIEAVLKECGVKSYDIPERDMKNRVIICALDKKTPGEAIKVGGSLLDGRAGAFANIVVIVDCDIDPHDYSTVAWKFYNNTDPARDIVRRVGGVIVDATRKMRGERHDREWPEDIVIDEKTKAGVDRLWPKLGTGG
ncbi:MAG: menaquinone biosynthesis decarboxylase [Nitrospinota bacterium]